MSSLEGVRLRDAIRVAVGKHLDLTRHDVFIFGSEAAGTGSKRSDVDIGILGPGPVSKATIQRIRDELEGLRTLRVFDIVDFSHVDESFKSVALQHVQRL